MNIFYRLGDKLYVNITNKCSCDCVFCIRKNGDSVGDADTLWLEHEPSFSEVSAAFARERIDNIEEIVFCGYGEPMERAEDVVLIAKFIKSKTTVPVRLNTNGLVKLINPDFDIARLNIFDSISVSLNADNAEDYQKLTRTVFGEKSFDSMLGFAQDARAYTNVAFTIVDTAGVDIDKCKEISNKTSIPLRVRTLL
ncbi:MAG: TatD family nuclease-associated radical SAM protein [Oscillospiraceae bacterium]|nr:TatD family nuclease-associated radical SAM protein [Oscillospiraceae bacterium]